MILKQLNNLKENNQIEFKKTKGGLPGSLWETYSAFANTNGGTIILGIDEPRKNQFVSAKLTEGEINDLKKKFWNIINNSEKISRNILVDKDVYEDIYDSYPILIIKIRRASRYERPIYINNNLYNGTYRRNYEGDYHCTKQEIDLMIKDSSYISSDKTCLEEFSLNDFNVESINSYKQMLKATTPSHIFLTMSDEEFYLNLGIARKGSDGLLHPTRAGLLMFGKEYRITDEFSHYFLDYQNHREETPDIRWIDRVQSSSGEWSGNVFDFFFRVYNKLIQDLIIPFQLDGVNRIDDTEMHKALREALCNTLSNADYYGTRGIVIKKYKDKIEFYNPGCMRMSIEEAFEGGNTDPRNETILKIFSLIKIGERAGTGLQTILNIVKNFGCRKPTIEEYLNPDRTKLTIYLDYRFKLDNNTNDNYKRYNALLSKDENKVYLYIYENNNATRLEIEQYCNFGKTKCSLILKSLLEKDLISRNGCGRSVCYNIK